MKILYVDATVIQESDLKHIIEMFPNLEKLSIEGQNIYNVKFSLLALPKVKHLELIVNPADNDEYPGLLSGGDNCLEEESDSDEESFSNGFDIVTNMTS